MGIGDKEYDVFRDSKLRYLGYANEVGESFRSVVPISVVRASYYVAFGYVVADTIDKSCKMMKKDGRITKVMSAAGDALIWQTLASIIIPGIAINRIRGFSCYLLSKRCCSFQQSTAVRWLPLAIGLVSIPFIVTPIDTAVTIFMDNTYRRLCAITCYLLTKRSSVSRNARCWLTVGAGLASIPIIVSPIDAAVTVVMDNTYRKIV